MTLRQQRARRTPFACALVAAAVVFAGSPMAVAPTAAHAAVGGTAKKKPAKAAGQGRARTKGAAKAKPRALAPVDPALAAAIGAAAGGSFSSFYAARANRPVWLARGRATPAATALLGYLRDARYDGLKAGRYDLPALNKALSLARSGSVQQQADAEIDLSKAFVRYVGDMRKLSNVGMEFAGKDLKPPRLDDAAIMRVAARGDLDDYVERMGWMSPHYQRMRTLVARGIASGAGEATMARLWTNLERARVLPSPAVRHIVVDAGSARLWYYENGRQVGAMKVVVGATETQTPMLAGYLNWAILNPYWNVPDYLARDNVARKILSGRTLASMNMQVLSDWSDNPRVVDPDTVDWKAVAAGKRVVRVRELPGPANSMGKVKYLFPNKHGIYLHDTPNRVLLDKSDRHLSNGCIRLERAAELGRWMMGRPVSTKSSVPEQAVPVPAPVPVYLTYLTATAKGRGVALLPDVYGRDR